MLTPGPVLLKCHVCVDKSNLLVDEVQLLQDNPQYAHVCYADGHETIVSLCHLAPIGSKSLQCDVLSEFNVQTDSATLPSAGTKGRTSKDNLVYVPQTLEDDSASENVMNSSSNAFVDSVLLKV